jgi:hypothetical protein
LIRFAAGYPLGVHLRGILTGLAGFSALLLVVGLTPTAIADTPQGGWLPDARFGPWERYTDPSGSVSYTPRQAAVDSEGRFVVLGFREDTGRGVECPSNIGTWAIHRAPDSSLAVGRFLPDGRADTTFGNQGVLVIPQFAHWVDWWSLEVSGSNIYVSTMPVVHPCGSKATASYMQRPPPPSAIVQISSAGDLIEQPGGGVTWEMPSSYGDGALRMGALPNGAVGTLMNNTFTHVSASGLTSTDLTPAAGEPPIDTMTYFLGGAPIASRGSVVASMTGIPVWDYTVDNFGPSTPAIFFGDLIGSRLEPDTRVSGTGVLELDVSPFTKSDGSFVSTGGSDGGDLGWDREGNLIALMTLAEPYPTISGGEVVISPHARALIVARFSPDAERGWVLDSTYGEQGLAYISLPMSGDDNFFITAFGLDSMDRPVVAGTWFNFTADTAGQFVLRITREGTIDRTYGGDTACLSFDGQGGCSAFGPSGITWLPGNTPNIIGEPALDNRDNVHFSSAWGGFSAARSQKRSSYQLGRVRSSGLIQVHDGRGWRTTKVQPKPRLYVEVQSRIPSRVAATDAVRVTARIGLPGAQAGTTTPIKGARVTLTLLGRRISDRQTLATGRTDRRGWVRLTANLPRTGLYVVQAQAPGYVENSSAFVRVVVDAR